MVNSKDKIIKFLMQMNVDDIEFYKSYRAYIQG